ncbi:PilZ domain-containing protein [Nisaea acidiphila]|uniref:PilZ domain-containing protein n=1 Tax=Nisaea acidiphila TaxID=1862145 RepID=A0A9J7AUH1_9PROT|nr:PilZ domain-containing protein [Nisaea acidiphila]UUX50975.1 PilZ domain-containing protein [Nisaea acidiphila]
MNAVAEAAIGQERRRHGRWSVSGAYAAVQGRKLPLIDISIGGFLARLPGEGGDVSSPLEGTIYWRGSRELIEFPFSAEIVRRLDSGESVAAQFHALEGESIDTLLRFLSAIEAERRERIEGEQRAAMRRILLRKLALWGVAGASILAALWLVWQFGLNGS